MVQSSQPRLTDLEDGRTELAVFKEELPPFLVRAYTAVEDGRISEAVSLLNDQAIETVHRMLAENPSRTDVMLVLATVFRKTKQLGKAEQWYKKLLEQWPHVSVYYELGSICQAAGRLSEAIEYRRKAVEAAPDDAEFLKNLGNTLICACRKQEGIDLLRKAVEKDPHNAEIHSSLLGNLHYLPDIRPQMLFGEHERWGQIHAPLSRARTSHDNELAPDRRLRVGYISPDFYMHPVAYFFEPLLDGHDPQAVEVYGYGSVEFPDRITERLRRKFGHYRDIHGINDETVVRLIEDDKIDILVDLTGHTAGNRLLVLACKPAPIQVTCLGYSNTTGMQAVDYRLTDSKLDSPESQKFYTEELVFLSGPFSCYRPSDLAPPIASLPALRNGYVTFGSFNNNCKIHPFIIKLWSQILRENGSSRLLLRFKGGSDHNVADYYYHQFEQSQVNRERVIIDGWQSYVEHLQMYKDVDIALDTYPWNGHTTTCEAMWMGVPTISLAGKSSVSRVGLSILSCVGLEFLATSTPEEYVAKAAALARNLKALAKMRASMRQRMTASALCNAKTYAGSVEAAYRKMWHRWCRSRGVEVPGEQLSETAYSRV